MPAQISPSAVSISLQLLDVGQQLPGSQRGQVRGSEIKANTDRFRSPCNMPHWKDAQGNRVSEE